MRPGENRRVVRRFFAELLTNANMNVAGEILAAGFVFHGATTTLKGIEDFKRTLAALHGSFSDQHYAIEDEVAEGKKLVARWAWRGMHQREYLGVSPTGKQVKAWGITIFRIESGKIAEGWEVWTTMGLLQQLGLSVRTNQ